MINFESKNINKIPSFTSPLIEWEISDFEHKLILSHFPDGVVALDLETTGLSPLVDRIIEIGAIKITPFEKKIFGVLINPEIPIPPHTILIHNISDSMVMKAPKFFEVIDEFKNFIGELPIIAHNAKFDLGFIVMGLRKEKHSLPESSIFCSCKISRFTFKEMANHKLSNLVVELNIPLVNHHRALDDAYASLKIFIQALLRLENGVREKNPKVNTDIKTHGHIFNLSQFGEISEEALPSHLYELIKLVKDAAVIEILYQGGSYKNQHRPVKLSGLLTTPDGNILYARCLWSDIYKSFKLSKIKDLRHPTALQIQNWLSVKVKKVPGEKF